MPFPHIQIAIVNALLDATKIISLPTREDIAGYSNKRLSGKENVLQRTVLNEHIVCNSIAFNIVMFPVHGQWDDTKYM